MGKADEERARRLAEALRRNLRRRKAQARIGDRAPDLERVKEEEEETSQ